MEITFRKNKRRHEKLWTKKKIKNDDIFETFWTQQKIHFRFSKWKNLFWINETKDLKKDLSKKKLKEEDTISQKWRLKIISFFFGNGWNFNGIELTNSARNVIYWRGKSGTHITCLAIVFILGSGPRSVGSNLCTKFLSLDKCVTM